MKSKAPGQSEVPAAKEYPRAAGQVWAGVPSGNVKLKYRMSWKKWKALTEDPVTGVPDESILFYKCVS